MTFYCFQIIENDTLPEMICVECLGNITSACETKRKCIESDKSLRYLNQSACKEPDTTNVHLESLNLVDLTPAEIRDINEILVMTEPSMDENTGGSLIDSEVKAEPIETTSEERLDEKLRQNRQSKRKTNEKISESTPVKLKKSTSQHEKKFFCETCGEHFKNNSDLRNHCLLKHVKDVKEFFCDSCSFNSKRKKNVERHIFAVHMKSYKFTCPISDCKRQYTTQAALKLHCVRDHDESSQYKCEKCQQKFSCESLLKIHNQRLTCRPRKNKSAGKKVIEKTFACPHCDFRTAHQYSLTQHVNLIHLNIRKTWKCSHCENTEFSNRISLNHHMFNVHNLSHIRCPDCDQAFSSDSQLLTHKTSLKCNARKATEDDYEETESGVKCNLCNRSYKTRKEWITHYFNHHKFNKICDICNIQLSTYASLKNHKKTIHDKIKAFACTECPKKFSAKHTLEFHLNTHSGMKPYSCKWCSFKASDRSSISKHQKSCIQKLLKFPKSE